MNLQRLLKIFRRNELIIVLNEYDDVLFRGPIWWLDSKYILSSLVVDVYRNNYLLTIVVAQ